MEHFVLGVAGAYIGGQLAKGVSEGMSAANKALVTSVLTNAGAGAATGRNFDEVLKGAITGGVTGLITNAVRTEFKLNPKQFDDKLILNATTAATRAILNGKPWDEAVGASIANTAIGTAVNSAASDLRRTNRELADTQSEIQRHLNKAESFKERMVAPQEKYVQPARCGCQFV
jgi:hypothetical protein